jgi:hypothetical protein
MTKGNAFRLLGLVLCCALLVALLAGGALQSTASAVAQSFGPHRVEGGTISGGGYRLVAAVWQVSGAASGGDYRLLRPPAPGPVGSGCCCTYLPCVLDNW